MRGPLLEALHHGSAAVTRSQGLRATLDAILHEFGTNAPALLAHLRRNNGVPPDAHNPAAAECVLLAIGSWRSRMLRPILFSCIEEWRRTTGASTITCRPNGLAQ